MKTIPTSVLGAIALMALIALGGCATQEEQAQEPVQAPAPGVQSTADAYPPAQAQPRFNADRPWEDPSSPLYRRVIYFDYDSSEIRPEFIPTLQAHAGYLASHAATRVTLEGHTDERGTREYNLALRRPARPDGAAVHAGRGGARRSVGDLELRRGKARRRRSRRGEAGRRIGASSWPISRRWLRLTGLCGSSPMPLRLAQAKIRDHTSCPRQVVPQECRSYLGKQTPSVRTQS